MLLGVAYVPKCQREPKSDIVEKVYRKAGKPVTKLQEIIEIHTNQWLQETVFSRDMQINGMVGAVCHGKIIQCLNRLMR